MHLIFFQLGTVNLFICILLALSIGISLAYLSVYIYARPNAVVFNLFVPLPIIASRYSPTILI